MSVIWLRLRYRYTVSYFILPDFYPDPPRPLHSVPGERCPPGTCVTDAGPPPESWWPPLRPLMGEVHPSRSLHWRLQLTVKAVHPGGVHFSQDDFYTPILHPGFEMV